MNGSFGQYGGGGQSGSPAFGGQAVAIGDIAAAQPIAATMPPAALVPQAGGSGGGVKNPLSPFTQMIPSFPQLVVKVDGMARALPWYLWLALGAFALYTWQHRSSSGAGWLGRLKKVLFGSGGSASK